MQTIRTVHKDVHKENTGQEINQQTINILFKFYTLGYLNINNSDKHIEQNAMEAQALWLVVGVINKFLFVPSVQYSTHHSSFCLCLSC